MNALVRASNINSIVALAAGLFWAGGEKIMAIWAYYDESGIYDDKGDLENMSIGGCVAPFDSWQEFDAKWKEVLDAELSHVAENKRCFHMTDFEAWVPPFDFKLPNGERDREKHNRLLNQLLDILCGHIEGFYGYAAVYPTPDRRTAHKLQLEDCIVGTVKHAVMNIWDRYREPINLVFAKQEHFPESGIKKYVWLYDWGEAKDRIKGLSVYPACEVRPLQGADIIAYEMARVQRIGREERYPWKRLVAAARNSGGKIQMGLGWGPISARRADLG